MSTFLVLIRAMRPKHWIKNILVFVGIVYGKMIGETEAVSRVCLAFLSFCAAASSIYLFNDLRDVQEDRTHPVKKHRPLASGQLPIPLAVISAIALAMVSLGIAWALSHKTPLANGHDITQSSAAFFYYLAGYLGLNLAYTLGVKKVVIADVIIIALGFLLRVIAGTAVINLITSSWLILCTFYLALFLALAKRRGEVLVTLESGGGRSVLKDYDPKLLDLLISLAAISALLTYSIYTAAPETVLKLHTRNLLFTVPIVFYGIGRYLYLMYRRGLGDDPVSLFYKDRHLWITVIIWFGVSALFLYLAPESPPNLLGAPFPSTPGGG